jgi:hypothetical protein
VVCPQIEEMVEVPVVLELASDLLDRRCPIFRCGELAASMRQHWHGLVSAVQMPTHVFVLIRLCSGWILWLP